MSRHIPPAYPVPPAYPGSAAPPGATPARGVPCRLCGHDLSGLTAVIGRCPGCGAAAGFTLEGELIRYADVAWQRRVASGVRLVIAGTLVVAVAAIVAMVAIVVELFMPGKPTGRASIVILIVGAAAGYLISIRGHWKLTARDPSGAGEARYGRSRRLARWGLLIGLIGAQAGFMRGFAEGAGWTATMVELIVAEVVIGFSTLAVIVGLFAELDYLRKLIRRLRDLKLASRADFLFRALGTTFAAVQLLELGKRYLILADQPEAVGALGLLTFPAGIALFVFVVMYVGMLDRLGKKLIAERTLAEETWAGAPAPPADHLHPAAPA